MKRDPHEGQTADQQLIDAYEGFGLRGGDDGSGSKGGTMGTDAPLTFRQSFISLHGPEAWAAYQKKIKSAPPPTDLERNVALEDAEDRGLASQRRDRSAELIDDARRDEWDSRVLRPPPPDGGPPNIPGSSTPQKNVPDWVWEPPSRTRVRSPEELLNFPTGRVGVKSSEN